MAAARKPSNKAHPQADARTRTGDPFITSEVLYQLSYVGSRPWIVAGHRRRGDDGPARAPALAPGGAPAPSRLQRKPHPRPVARSLRPSRHRRRPASHVPPRRPAHSSTRHHGTTTRSMPPTAVNSATPITASTTTAANTSAVAVWLP